MCKTCLSYIITKFMFSNVHGGITLNPEDSETFFEKKEKRSINEEIAREPQNRSVSIG